MPTVIRLVALLLGLASASCDKFAAPTLPPAATGPAPATTISSAPRARTRLRTATLQLQASDPAATFQCSFDGEPYLPCASPATRDGLAPGPHTFRAYAVLADGRYDP